MANIPTYDQPELGLRPSEVGAEAFAAAGRRGAGFFNQAGEALSNAGARLGTSVKIAGDSYVNAVTHQQVIDGQATATQTYDNLLAQKDAAIKSIDPDDPHYGTKVELAIKQWREENVEPAFENFQKGFTTQEGSGWAASRVDQMRQHLDLQTNSEIAQASRIGISNSVKTTISTASNTAFRDPTSVPMLIDQLKHSVTSIVGSSPIKGIDVAKVNEEVLEPGIKRIVHAAATSSIINSPDPEAAAAEWSRRYPEYVDGTESAQLAKAAKIQSKTNRNLDLAIQNEQKRAQDYAVTSTLNDSFSNHVTFDQTGKANIDAQFVHDVNDLPKKFPNSPLAWEKKKELGEWIAHQQKTPNGGTTDPTTASALDARMFDPNNPTTEVDLRKAQVDGKLSNHDFAIRDGLVKARDAQPIKDPTFKTAMAAAKEIIEPKMGGVGLGSPEKYVGFLHNFMGQYLALSREGKLPANALDLNDPKSLISTTMQQYKPSLGAVISGNGGVAAAAPAAPAAPPKEKTISTKAEYDALPSNADFVMNGKKYTKP